MSIKTLGFTTLLAVLTVATPIKAQDSLASHQSPIVKAAPTQTNQQVTNSSLPNSASIAKNPASSKVDYIAVITGGFLAGCPIFFPIVTFCFQYHREQKWKTREFIASLVKEFEAQPEIINVRKMLNTESQLVDLFPTATLPVNRFIVVNDTLLNKALEKQENRDDELKLAQERYQKALEEKEDAARRSEPKLCEAAIRDNFNRFADFLQQFNTMIDANLATANDLSPYLNHWFALIFKAAERVKNADQNQEYNILSYLGLLNIEDECFDETQLSEVQRNIRSLYKRCAKKRKQEKHESRTSNQPPSEQPPSEQPPSEQPPIESCIPVS